MVKMMMVIVESSESDKIKVPLLAKSGVLSLSKFSKNDVLVLEQENSELASDQVDVADENTSFISLVERYKADSKIETLFVLVQSHDPNDFIETFKPDFVRIMRVDKVINAESIDMQALENSIVNGEDTNDHCEYVDVNLSAYKRKMHYINQMITSGRRFSVSSTFYCKKDTGH